MYYADFWNIETRECEFRKCASRGQCNDGQKITYYDWITSDGKSEYQPTSREQYCCNNKVSRPFKTQWKRQASISWMSQAADPSLTFISHRPKDMCNSAVSNGLSWLLTAGATLAAVLALSWDVVR